MKALFAFFLLSTFSAVAASADGSLNSGNNVSAPGQGGAANVSTILENGIDHLGFEIGHGFNLDAPLKRAGFEVGHGFDLKEPVLVTNGPGNYGLQVSRSWNIRKDGSSTTVIGTLEEGVPHEGSREDVSAEEVSLQEASLRITVENNPQVKSIGDLFDKNRDPDWGETAVGNAVGIERVTKDLANEAILHDEILLLIPNKGVCSVDIRGVSGTDKLSTYDKMQSALLRSFQVFE